MQIQVRGRRMVTSRRKRRRRRMASMEVCMLRRMGARANPMPSAQVKGMRIRMRLTSVSRQSSKDVN